MNNTPAPAPTDHDKKEEMTLMLGLQFAGELGYIIALPAVAFGFGGAYLDKYLHMSPLFFLLGICVALTLSTIGVVKKIKEITKSQL